MIRLLDGPAAGVRLELRRAPQFLRVVIDPSGEVDALDQLDDEPRADERVHVYRLAASPSRVIACSRGRGGGCRPLVLADYYLHGVQPADADARETDRWRAWTAAQAACHRPPESLDHHA